MRIQGFPYEYFDGIDCEGNESPKFKDNNFIKTFLVEKKSFVCPDEYTNSLEEENFKIAKDIFETNVNQIKKAYKEIDNKYPTTDDATKRDREQCKQVEKQKIDKILKEKIANDSAARVIIIHAVWLWSYPVNINFKNALRQYGIDIAGDVIKTSRGTAGIGMASSQKQEDIIFILSWFCNSIECSSIKDIKDKYINSYKNNTDSRFSKNMLLHLCKPEDYEPIGLQEDKKRIVEAFGKKDIGVDNALAEIRNKVTSNNLLTFYSNGFMHFWKNDDNLNDDYRKLLYKKAMVLYGPPGTGKTYVATNLANELIGRKFAEAYKQNNDQQIINAFFEKNIFRLQLHVNYTYEDFVAGVVIENNSTKVQEGYIYKVIERANELSKICPELPVVVILDEINRTDISRVFGELFSAIEKRGETIDLSLQENGQPKQICIPDNVYFIGTMNEIDFSLERVDFALRRRFIWLLKTFETKALETILKEKDHEDIIDRNYVSLCTKLNKAITDEQELGEKFVIGHAFFSEIADIMDDLSMKYDEARLMLWEISIHPTLEAYCGSMDKRKQNEFIEKCVKAFDFEYKDGKVSLKSTGDTQTPNQPTIDTSVNGTTEENSTDSADE